jgi:hypothetical protein
MFMDVRPQRDVVKEQVKKLEDSVFALITEFEKATGLLVCGMGIRRIDITEMGSPPASLLDEVYADVLFDARGIVQAPAESPDLRSMDDGGEEAA